MHSWFKSPRFASTAWAVVCVAMLGACASTSGAGKGGAATAGDDEEEEGIGYVLEAFVAGAAKFNKPQEFTMDLDANGDVSKVVLKHMDADKVPAAVKKAAEAAWPGAQVVAYEWEFYAEDGEVHEVELKTADGTMCELSAKPDGTVRYKECAVKREDVPAKAMSDAEAKLPGAELVEAEKKEGGSESYFSLKFKTSGGQVHYLRYGLDGAYKSRALRLPANVKIGM